MKKLVYYIGILVCTGIFLSSCIAEDMSNCPPDNFVLQFVLVPHEGNDGIINESLYTAKLFVFNAADTLVATYHIDVKPELNKIYVPDWGLLPGKYTYVAWINYNRGPFEVDPAILGETTRTQMLLRHLIPKSSIVDNTQETPILCFGQLAGDLLDTPNQLITIPVMQFTNKINLTMKGLKNELFTRASTEINHQYEFAITDNNGVYGFDGEFIHHDHFTYSTTKYADSDTLNASLTVLKLAENRQPVVTVTNQTTGVQIFTGNLVQYILASNPNNDFDTTHVYDIVIDFGDGEMDIPVTITINGWVLDSANYELNIN